MTTRSREYASVYGYKFTYAIQADSPDIAVFALVGNGSKVAQAVKLSELREVTDSFAFREAIIQRLTHKLIQKMTENCADADTLYNDVLADSLELSGQRDALLQ